jgi:RNA polymerase sigma-70 factor (ECF subfamily)
LRREDAMAAIAVKAQSDPPSSKALSVQEHNVPSAEAMYADHYAEVMRYVRARVASRELAEDLVSDVFCRALAALSSYRQLRDTPLPWLYAIAAHRVADHYRSQRATFPIETIEAVADGADGPDEVVTARESMREVWEASKVLPQSQRRALWFRYGEDLELKEIATRMERSVEAVKLLIHRAVRGIRRALEITDLASVGGARAENTSQRVRLAFCSPVEPGRAAKLSSLLQELEAA